MYGRRRDKSSLNEVEDFCKSLLLSPAVCVCGPRLVLSSFLLAPLTGEEMKCKKYTRDLRRMGKVVKTWGETCRSSITTTAK
jgi:hypothetical protein